jgi:alanyl-tRNA synthetase
VVASSPLVPRNDPTLMFTNSGMVQFKNCFTGVETARLRARHHGAEMRARGRQAQRPRQCGLYRAAPHLLRNAGQLQLWRLFQGTGHPLCLGAADPRFRAEPDRTAVVTVYHTDDEAAGIWKKVTGLPDHKIIRIATDDNFWRMGPDRALRALHRDLL